jgi:hypothetical protein
MTISTKTGAEGTTFNSPLRASASLAKLRVTNALELRALKGPGWHLPP